MRTCTNDRFDAVVDYTDAEPGRQIAYAIVKMTWHATDHGLAAAPPQPLFRDTRIASVPHRLAPGSDFSLWRDATDVAVLGSAHSPRPSPHGQIEVRVGDRRLRRAVFGRRSVTWDRHGRPRVSAPESYTELPMRLANAYGGTDPRVPIDPSNLASASTSHAGTYPRNPFGTGYLLRHDPIEGVELPSFERADDLLTDERLIADPTRWWVQPRPAFTGFVPPNVFPRCALFGVWPVPTPPIAAGALVDGLAIANEGQRTGESLALDRRFAQEAVPELTFASLAAGTPLSIAGMRPDGRSLGFALPESPSLTLLLGGERLSGVRTLASVVVEPADSAVCMVWTFRSDPLRRVLVRGIHRRIQLVAVVDGTAVPHDCDAYAPRELGATHE